MIRTYVYGALPPTQGAKHVEQQLQLAHRYRNKLVEIERARRGAIVAAGEDAEVKERAHTDAKEAIRVARAESGVYWGTYLLIEDDAQRSNRSIKDSPHFIRWEGRGRLGVQLQGGLSVQELLAGASRLIRLEVSEDGRRAEVHLRVASAGREPVWAVFPIVYHRVLPASACVKWVRASVRKVGIRSKWEVHFVLENVDARLPAPTLGHVAIDVGWRRFPGAGVRVAAWVDNAGQRGELRLPERLIQRWAKVSDLLSIRDKHFNAQREVLVQARSITTAAWPEWLRETTETLHAWKSPDRLRQLAWQWTKNRFLGDDEVFSSISAWLKQEIHLLSWGANQRENVLRARHEIYRMFALQVSKYNQITIERLDLRDFAELPEPSERPENPRTTASRGRRFQASLHELLACVADAAGRSGAELTEVDPAWSTQKCSGCDQIDLFDAAGSVTHTCSCGRTWDQDYNAAENLLRAPPESIRPPGRSRRQTAGGIAESAVQLRRRAGKAQTGIHRSNTTNQVAGNTQ